MEDGTKTLQEGLQIAYNALKIIDSESPELKNASTEVFEILEILENNTSQYTFSLDAVDQLREASTLLLDVATQLENGLSSLSNLVNISSFEEKANYALEQYGVDLENISPDAQILYDTMQAYISEINSYLFQSAQGAATLQSGLAQFDKAISTLSDSIEVLNNEINQFQQAFSSLYSAYAEFNNGIIDYTDGLHEFYDGFHQIIEGAENLNNGASELTKVGEEFRDGILELQTKTNEMLDEYFPYEMNNLIDFMTASDNPRIKAANDDVSINQSLGIFAGIIVIILITYVISVFVVHSIDRESTIIGALYALGIKRQQLMLHYTMLPVLLCLMGAAIGTAIGYSQFGIQLFVGESFTYYSTPRPEIVWNPLLLVYGILVPPIIAYIVNTITIRKRLRQNALSLLRKEQKNINEKGLYLSTKLSYIRIFQIRQFFRERRSSFAVLAGMFVSMLVLVLGLTCYAVCHNIQANTVADVQYEYMYLYKYPSETVPKDGYEAYVEGLKKEIMGYDMEVTIIGLTEENPFFPKIHSSRNSEISISTSVAQKFHLSVGDSLTLKDELNEIVYSFEIVEVVPYSTGLCAFMNIESMRELWNQDADYFNAVYSTHELEVESGRLYSLSTRTDAIKSAGIFMQNMSSTMITLIIVAIVIFFVVLYQMMKVMIDRSAQNISLMKIFGYRNKEIRKLYLDGNFVLITVGAIIILPLSKYLTDVIYPYLVANVASGIDLSWQLWMYLIVYVGILVSYVIVQFALMHKVKKTSPVELLKDRE